MAKPFEGWEKPNWDDWFMAQLFVIAMRSIDTNTKCGCIVVDKNHRVLSSGYNGPPGGCDDSQIPMTHPEKPIFKEDREGPLDARNLFPTMHVSMPKPNTEDRLPASAEAT